MYEKNAEVREDAIGAQATAKQNKTFAEDARIWKLPRLALLVMRRLVKRQRKGVKEGLTKVNGEARERQLQLREEKIATALSSKHGSFIY